MRGFIDINDIHKSGSENRPLTHVVPLRRQESNAQACPPAVLGWSAAINTSVGRHTLSDVVENLRRLPAPTLPQLTSGASGCSLHSVS